MYTPADKALDLLRIPPGTQMFHGGTQARLYRSKWPAKDIRNLALTHALVICQFQYLAVVGL